MPPSTSHHKIAVCTESSQYEALRQLAVAVLGAREVVAECGMSALQLGDGTLLELYSSYASYPAYLFQNGSVVVSFKVADLQDALRRAGERGFKALTPIVSVEGSLTYCHLELASGAVVGFYQEDVNPELPHN